MYKSHNFYIYWFRKCITVVIILNIAFVYVEWQEIFGMQLLYGYKARNYFQYSFRRGRKGVIILFIGFVRVNGLSFKILDGLFVYKKCFI